MEAQLPPLADGSSGGPRRAPALEDLPLECIHEILENLATDCHALHMMLLMNRTWFQMVIPFLYRSPMALIDATWPKLSHYSQVLKKEQPPPPPSPLLLPADSMVSDDTRSRQQSSVSASDGSADAGIRYGRSPSNTRRTSTTSSNGGVGGGGSVGYGLGYAPRTHSRSSSHSSTRSWAGDAFYHGKNEAVIQRDQRERLIKRKKLQVLWLLLNCTLTEEEHEARIAATSATRSGQTEIEERHTKTIGASSLLSLEVNPDLDLEVEYFRPMVDYLSFYTHYNHVGLRFTIWKLFPNVDDAFVIEWRLINHCPEKLRELFLESVQLQDMLPLVSRLKKLHRIKACHESWDVPGSIEFMKQHNQHFGAVTMLELEAYLPDKHDTIMDDNFSDLIAQVDRLTVLELAGFESLTARLELIPRRDLKILRLNCGTLTPPYAPEPITLEVSSNGSGNTGTTTTGQGGGRMSISTFLSQCRQLEELLLDPVDESMLEWAVQERRDFQVKAWRKIGTSAHSWSDFNFQREHNHAHKGIALLLEKH